MQLDPRRVLLLRVVRTAGSVLAASQALHLTPSNVSQQLVKLEREAGVALVDRTVRGGGRSIRLTAAGHALADHADGLADALAAAERDIARLRETPAGPLRIGGFSVALSELAVPVAVRMAAAEPALDPCVYEVSDAEGERMLLDDELDVLLTERRDQPERPAELTEADIARDPFQVVVPSSWPSDADPAALLARPWITTTFEHPIRHLLQRLCHEHGLELDAHGIGTGSAPTLLALVANGVGATIIPALTLRQNPTPNVRVSTTIPTPGSRTITAVHRHTAPATVPQLINELRRHAADPVV